MSTASTGGYVCPVLTLGSVTLSAASISLFLGPVQQSS